MYKFNDNGDNGLANHNTELYFGYNEGGKQFENWDELTSYWAEEYGSRAEADRKLRKIAYGTIFNRESTPLISAPVSGPLTTSQKKDLMDRAIKYVTGINA